MKIEVKIPRPGESIDEVELSSWLVADAQIVEQDQEIAVLESEKASLSLVAEKSGKIQILASAGKTIKVGSVVCVIDTDFVQDSYSETIFHNPKHIVDENIVTETKMLAEKRIKVSPVARELMKQNGIENYDFSNDSDRITRKDIELIIEHKKQERSEERTQMSMLRKKLSERLVSVQQNMAMLTTFNEIDMSTLVSLRKNYSDKFINLYGVKLGYMSFFTKAASLALLQYKNINAAIDGNDVVRFNYTDIGVAVQTEKGLMVPILKDVQNMSIPEIEKLIYSLAEKARSSKILLDELKGGTFTISNGGVFGSLLSTPIINPPQSAILGMHTIQDRPVAIEGKVEIRPMMYVALSYDHRIVDGKDSVGFLKAIKTSIENPGQLYDFQSLNA